MPDAEVFVMAVLMVALVRSVASIWLPHVGIGLTRQHKTSIIVGLIALIAVVVIRRQKPRHKLAVDA